MVSQEFTHLVSIFWLSYLPKSLLSYGHDGHGLVQIDSSFINSKTSFCVYFSFINCIFLYFLCLLCKITAERNHAAKSCNASLFPNVATRTRTPTFANTFNFFSKFYESCKFVSIS